MLKNILNLEGVTVLNKFQQQQIQGSGGCAVLVGGAVFTGLEQGRAEKIGEKPGNRWCCDSCSSATWINGIQ